MVQTVYSAVMVMFATKFKFGARVGLLKMINGPDWCVYSGVMFGQVRQ